MSYDIKTPLQYRIIDVFDNNINQYNTFDSNVILANKINKLTNIYGDNFIISGLYPISFEYIDNIFSIRLCGGIFIQDNTIIQIDDQISLSIDVSNYDIMSGYFIVHLNFSYLDLPNDNNIKIILQYISNDNLEISPHGWSLSRDKIYIDIFKYNNNLNKFETLYTPYIRIKDKIYYYRGINNNNLNELNYYYFKNYLTGNIKQVDLIQYYPNIQIDFLNNDKYNQLILFDRNVLNKKNITTHDSRYFIHDTVLKDKDGVMYNIYDYGGNIILDSDETIEDIIKPLILTDLSVNLKFKGKQYGILVKDGNIILDEPYNICENVL